MKKKKAYEQLTVSDLALYYEAMRGDELGNARTYRSNIRRILDFFGGRYPQDIGPADCIKYRKQRGASDGTVRRELGVLMAVCRFGVKHRLLAREDLPIIERPATPPPRDRWLDEGELCDLVSAGRSLRTGDRISRIERFLWLAIMTAARFDAILTLEWSQIDWGAKMIHFNPPGRQQTKKRRASVTIADELLIMLREAYLQRVSEFVLDNKKDIRGDFRKAVKLSGLGGVTPNVLRHSAATHMARRGTPLWQIAGVLGNSMATVEKNYAHRCPRDTREAVGNIPAPNIGELI